MKFASIREFRAHIHSLIYDKETVVITKHGKPVFFGFPWGRETESSLAEKRQAFKALAPERKKYFSHIDEKELMRDFESFRKERRSRRGR